MKEKLFRFMQGRYGNDTLNNYGMWLCILLLVISLFTSNSICSLLAYIIWFIVIYRTFSRKTYIRYQENQKFLSLISPITRQKNLYKKRKQDPTHKYYRCPQCKQIVRLPKGHGKVIVTCPKCHHQFEKRT